ncbi:MAG: hypothetical protein ACI8RZ_000995 [Myxococcota bacterium]|jgi:hypothetical protein
MPLFEFRCEDCGSMLELLLSDGAKGPKSCGFRCPLPPTSTHAARGMGTLTRQVSTFAAVQSVALSQTVTPEQAAKAGMTTYANEGGGKLRRIAGTGGPETIDVGKD